MQESEAGYDGEAMYGAGFLTGNVCIVLKKRTGGFA